MHRAPNDSEAPKSPNKVVRLSSILYIYSHKMLGSNMGVLNVFLVPGAI